MTVMEMDAVTNMEIDIEEVQVMDTESNTLEQEQPPDPECDGSVNSILHRKFPRLSTQTIPEVLELMPSAQVLSLWKTLNNLFHDSLEKLGIASDAHDLEREFFLVTHYLTEFLENLRVMDPTFVKMSMPKVEHLMNKVSQSGLRKLGLILLEKKYENEIFISFLNLVCIWGELNGILSYYGKISIEGRPTVNPVSVDQSPEDLSFFHSYLSSAQWKLIVQQIDGFGDSNSKALIVKLVGQKLKFLQVEMKHKDKEVQDKYLSKNLQISARYIFDYMKENFIENFDPVLYKIILPFLEDLDILDLSTVIVQQIPIASKEKLANVWNSEDPKLPYCLILNIFREIFHKLSKSDIQKKVMKKLSKETFSREECLKLIAESNYYEAELKANTQSFLSNLLNVTNNLIGSGCEDDAETGEQEFLNTFIQPLITYLAVPLEDFPKSIRTIIMLSSISCLITLRQCASHSLMNSLLSIIGQCASDFKGNEVIFHINWTGFFKWFFRNMQAFEVNVQRRLVFLILRNVYVSSTLVSSFQHEIDQYLISTDLSTHHSSCLLYVQEFLNKMDEEYSHSKAKSKVSEQVKTDLKEYTKWTLKCLEMKPKVKETPKHLLVSMNFFHSLLVLQHRLNIENSLDNVKVQDILSEQVDNALNYLTKSRVNIDGITSSSAKFLLPSRYYALGFLYFYIKSGQKLPNDFMKNLWDVVQYGPGCSVSENLDDVAVVSAVDIFKLSSDEEFQHIMDNLVQNWVYDEERIKTLRIFMTEMLDTELSPAKKTIRRRSIESCLVKIVATINDWKSTPGSINHVILPFLQFQTTLIRRRHALCSTNSLSLCLTSITSAPLERMENIKSFRKVFCAVAELLNSFTVHRLDVLSFRGHVHLQCFQYLVEALTMQADQGNNLSDNDILELKYCAHSIERICQSAKLGPKEFTRMSPYFIGVLMRQFEIFTVYPAVKEPLLSGCYKLLDLCDNHGIAQLNSMFTLGSREIFKTVYDVYKKFYRYLGKV